MTLLNVEYTKEIYRLSFTERQMIRDMFDDNKLIDHCTFYDNSGTICLIAHGNDKLHKVWLNGKWRTSKELAPLIRNELSISNNTNIMVRLFCYHGAYIGGYRDENTLIISAFYNKPVLNLTCDGYMAKFAYVA